MLESVAQHQNLLFRSSWSNYGEAGKGTLRILPPGRLIDVLREDYARKQETFFGEPPEFNPMMAALKEWESQFNQM